MNQISGSIIVQAASGRLFFYPPGGVNYVAVEDVAAGHIAAAERDRTGERYILAGKRIPLDANRVWLSGQDIYADGSKALEELAMADALSSSCAACL